MKTAAFDYLVIYRNRRGDTAVQVDGEGALILEDGGRAPSNHPMWEMTDEEAELRDLTPKQRRSVLQVDKSREELERSRQQMKERALQKERERLEREKQKAEEKRLRLEREAEQERMRRLNLDSIWEKLVQAIYKETKADSADMFLNWEDPDYQRNPDPSGFESYLATVSGDVGQSLDFFGMPKAEALYDKFMMAWDAGYRPDRYSNAPQNKREIRMRLSEVYSEAWYEAAWRDFQKAQGSRRWPEILAQKYIGWGNWRSLNPVLKKRALVHLKQGDIEGARMAVGWTD